MITEQQRVDVSELYVALFGRAPDSEGLGFWVQELESGKTLTEVANTMYAVDAARAYYPNWMTNGEIIASFYQNVLGRTADAEGLAFWTAKLNADGATVGSVITEMVDVVVAYSGTDADALASQALFNNKVEVAEYYGTHNGTVAGATAILASVTADPTTADAAIASIDAPVTTSISLSTGLDVLTGTSGDDSFVARVVQNANGEQTNQLATGDQLDGGAGNDTLVAKVQMASALNTSAQSAIAPETVDVENALFTALTVDNSTSLAAQNEVVTINAKDMLGLDLVSSLNSDASLVIENLTTLKDDGVYADRRDTEEVTIRMDHSGNGSAVDAASDLTVLFDNDYLIAGGNASDSTNYWLEDRQGAAVDASEPLNSINVDGVKFTLAGVAKNVFIDNESMSEFLNGAGTWENFVALLNEALATATLTDPSLASLSFSLDYTNLRTTGLDGTTLPVAAPAIVLTSNTGVEVIATGFHAYDAATGQYDVFGAVSDEPSVYEQDPVTATVELFKAGRGGDGGDLTIGGMDTDLANEWDYDTDAIESGVEVFNVTVEGDQTQFSSLASLQSTNNTLAQVNVEWATGSLADLIIGNSETVADADTTLATAIAADGMTTLQNYALKDVRVFTATNNNSAVVKGETITNDVELHAYLSDEIVDKYMNLTDVADDALLDNAAFAYTFGAGNDLLNININKLNLAESGSTTREDFSLSIQMGSGNDTVETQIGDGVGVVADAWYINSNLEDNLEIVTGIGDDSVSTWGAGSWRIDLGADNDVVYSDNSGKDVNAANEDKAVWVFNTADQAGATATDRDITDLVSDANDTYKFYGATVTVNLRGITATLVLDTYKTTETALNNAIKAIIQNDEYLSDLISATDGTGNTLVIRSLTDGIFDADDLTITVTAPSSLATMGAAQIALYNAANGTTFTTAAQVLADVTTSVGAWVTAADYVTAMANDGTNDLGGDVSANATASSIIDGTGADTIVLSTSGLDTETVNLTADATTDVIYNATNAIIHGLGVEDIVVTSDGQSITGFVGADDQLVVDLGFTTTVDTIELSAAALNALAGAGTFADGDDAGATSGIISYTAAGPNVAATTTAGTFILDEIHGILYFDASGDTIFTTATDTITDAAGDDVIIAIVGVGNAVADADIVIVA